MKVMKAKNLSDVADAVPETPEIAVEMPSNSGTDLASSLASELLEKRSDLNVNGFKKSPSGSIEPLGYFMW